jgi:hypothetical protein
MDFEKMKLSSDFRLQSAYGRAGTLARQHKPFIAFLLFASFVFLCMKLPWNSTLSQIDHEIQQYNQTLPPGNGTIEFIPETLVNTTKKARFAKVAVASGFEDILYERALDTHVQHALRHGYPMYMARENAADGMFNKIAYILDILLNELFKPADERVDWLL